MKKLFFLFAFLGLVSFAANAQSCKYAKKAKGEKSTCVKSQKAAASAALIDDAIESRTCAKSGKVSYVRKVVNNETGAVSYQDVEYCTKSKKFINASPAGMKATCTKSAKASCSKSAKATKASMSAKGAKKACCTGKDKAACCAGKSKKVKNTKASQSKVKLVKEVEN